jgi:hypothetical protein
VQYIDDFSSKIFLGERGEALAGNYKSYNNGRECIYGHKVARETKGGRCKACARDALLEKHHGPAYKLKEKRRQLAERIEEEKAIKKDIDYLASLDM